MIALVFSGCSTHLGYVPYDVYAPCLWPSGCTDLTERGTAPTYPQVKTWASQVQDGYDSRAVFNRQALYGGALLAAASTSALVGLAAFNTGGSVITALPIDAAFVGGTMAIYNNDQKAVIYGDASQTIRSALIESDFMLASGQWTEISAAVCVHAQVSEVILKVNNHITLLDPKNVADQLKGVAKSVQQKQTTAINKQTAATAAQKKAQAAQMQAKNAPSRENENLAQQADADTAISQADAANADAKNAQDNNTVQSLAAAATDFSDLQQLPTLEDMPRLQNYCFPESAGKNAAQ